MNATRTLVVWCPDWLVVAAGASLAKPAAVLRANRVVACSPAARAEGVAVHQRRRDAQARCPDLVVVDDDLDRAARAFEPVPQRLETLTPRLEIVRPGCCALPTRGPSRYHGGDVALGHLAASLAAAVLTSMDPVAQVRVGVADGFFAAAQAARSADEPRPGATACETSKPLESAGPRADRGRVPGHDDVGTRGRSAIQVVAPGESASFLAPLPLEVLDRPELTDVLRRLGMRTLGDLAALPTAKVVGRFGTEGLTAHRLARGLDERPPTTPPPPPDLRVDAELDPPVERVEAAAFVARGLADDLHRRLAERGSACTRLLVGAMTEHGEQHERLWRTEGAFTPTAVADRLRWQLEGWLQSGAHRPTGGISRLWFVPDEVVAAGGRQLSFSTGLIDEVEAADRAGRSSARVQGLVGVEGVLVPEWRGGRGPGERMSLTTVGASDLSEPRPATRSGWVSEPWPGSTPEPSPAVVHPEPVRVDVLDATRRPVEVTGRGDLQAPPAWMEGQPVTAWAGPWPCDERWWDSALHRRRARMQVTVGGTPYLLVLEGNQWAVEATYD